MSTNTVDIPRKVTTATVAKLKQQGEKIAMVTAYDFTTAQLVDESGVELILVGDSAANVMAGYSTTLPITVDEMIIYARSVVRGAQRAMVIVDMPFGSYQGNPDEALANAVRIIKETGAAAVKLEGGKEIRPAVEKILNAGIPVMAHLGLTPQSVNKFGGYGIRAKGDEEAALLLENAQMWDQLGCFALVLEKIPAALAAEVTSKVGMAIIGIGAGSATDGQVLVFQDMMGMNKGFKPKFLRTYANLGDDIVAALNAYVADVKSVSFPTPEESY